MNPLFTVVIPIYNKAEHLKRSINSVKAQTYTNYELILVDDSSTDGSYELAEELSKEFNNCSIYRRTEPGPGGYAGRNLGIEKAKGEWIAFLDADDEWSPGLLEEYVTLMGKYTECQFLGTARKEVTSQGLDDFDRFYKKYNDKKYREMDLLYYAKLGAEERNPIQTSSVAAKRDLLLQIGGFPHGKCNRGGDRDTWLRLFMSTNFAWSSYLGSTYFRNAGNMVTHNNPPTLYTGMDDTLFSIIKSGPLNKKYGKTFKSYVKQMSNMERRSAYKKSVLKGDLKISDLQYLYFSTDPKFYTTMLIWTLTPRVLRKLLLKIRNKKR